MGRKLIAHGVPGDSPITGPLAFQGILLRALERPESEHQQKYPDACFSLRLSKSPILSKPVILSSTLELAYGVSRCALVLELDLQLPFSLAYFHVFKMGHNQIL